MEQFIKFNDAESAQERSQTQPLSLEQEKKVVDWINSYLKSFYANDETLKAIQDFVNHYQNMSHLCIINGLFGEGNNVDEKIDDDYLVNEFYRIIENNLVGTFDKKMSVAKMLRSITNSTNNFKEVIVKEENELTSNEKIEKFLKDEEVDWQALHNYIQRNDTYVILTKEEYDEL